MKYNIENKVLTIFLKGQLNSSNAEDAEREIDDIVKAVEFKSIKFDLGELDYTSSAGLRIMIRVKKQYDDTSLVNVPDNIYEILDMVGFTNMMEIERK